jgi:hypothetical protein
MIKNDIASRESHRCAAVRGGSGRGASSSGGTSDTTFDFLVLSGRRHKRHRTFPAAGLLPGSGPMTKVAWYRIG